MAYREFVSLVHKSTKRDYLARVTQRDKAEVAELALQWGYDYWDGSRETGYGGYRYDGRWRKVADAMVAAYGIKPGMRILDVGAGKGFLLHDFLQAVPGVTFVDLDQPAVGLQSVNLAVLPAYRRQLELSELEAARDAGVEALVAVYHSDHRALCAHERDWPFRIVNLLEIVGQSMGLNRHDRFKELKIMQDADLIVAECRDMIAEHSIDPELARDVVAKAMLGEQPLPLVGRRALSTGEDA